MERIRLMQQADLIKDRLKVLQPKVQKAISSGDTDVALKYQRLVDKQYEQLVPIRDQLFNTQ